MNIAKQMEKNAVLFLGSAESLLGMEDCGIKPMPNTKGIFYFEG